MNIKIVVLAYVDSKLLVLKTYKITKNLNRKIKKYSLIKKNFNSGFHSKNSLLFAK